MSDEVRAGYDAPFPDDAYCAGPRAMPGLVPTSPDDPAAAANKAAWTKLSASPTPMLVAFSDSDPITGPMGAIFQREMPGAQGVDHPVHPGRRAFLAGGCRRGTGRLHRGVSAPLSRQLDAVTAEWAVGGQGNENRYGCGDLVRGVGVPVSTDGVLAFRLDREREVVLKSIGTSRFRRRPASAKSTGRLRDARRWGLCTR